MARAPRPETLIAGYGVAKNLLFMLFSSLMMVRQTVTTLGGSNEALAVLKRFFAVVVAINTAIVAGVAFTPLADVVFGSLMGVRAGALVHAKRILRVFALFPVIVGFRHFWQGVALHAGRSGVIAGAMTVRTVLLGLLVYVVLEPTVSTDAGAAFLFLGSVGAEGIVVYALVLLGGGGLALWHRRQSGSRDAGSIRVADQSGPREARDAAPAAVAPVPSYRAVLVFFVPLAVTALMRTAALPIVNAGLARMPDADLALASFTVGWEIGYILFAPLMFFHHVPLAFLAKPSGRSGPHLIATAALFGLASAAALAMLGFTPVGPWVLTGLVGVEGDLLAGALRVLRALTLLPLLYAAREYFWGVLMYRRTTRPIWVAKTANLAVLLGGVALFTMLLPGRPEAGVAAMLCAEAVEAGVLLVHARHKSRNVQTSIESEMGGEPGSP